MKTKNICIRNLRGGDFSLAVELWNACRPADPITPRVFKRKVILDVNFNQEGYFIAEADGKAVGYIYVIVRVAPLYNDGDMEEGIGTINGFGYLPDAPEGTGEALLAAGEAYARAKGLKKLVHSAYKPYYFTQGFDVEREPHYIRLFTDAGYTITTHSYARDIDLFHYQVPEEIKEARKKAEEAGFYIGPLTDDLLIPFWDYFNHYSSASWRIRMHQLLRDTDDYGRIRVAAYKGEVIGFNVFGDPDGSPERYGPFGLREDFRGLKLGQILLADLLYEMKRRGLHNAWMQSTQRGSSADHVYGKAGFTITRTHVPMEKTL